MNNGVPSASLQMPAGAAAAAVGQAPPAARQQHIFRPEQIRNLPEYFTAEEKTKWEAGLRQLWVKMNGAPPDSQPHMEAKKMLFDFSRNLTNRMSAFRTVQATGGVITKPAAAQIVAPGQQAVPMPSAIPNMSAEMMQQMAVAAAAKPGAPPGAMPLPLAQAQAQQMLQQQQQTKIPPKILEHVEAFPYAYPPQLAPDSPEAAAWQKSVKQKYMSGLSTMDSAKNRVQHLKAIEKKRTEEGKPFTPEETRDYNEKVAQAQKAHADASAWVEKFRASQVTYSKQANGQPGETTGVSEQQPPLTRPLPNPQQQAMPAMQTGQVSTAIEAARNQQQMGGGRPVMPVPNGQGGSGIMSAESAAKAVGAQQGQLRSADASHMAAQQGNPSQTNPSARSGSADPPRPLSHQAALQTAARTYSSGQTSGTPNVMGMGHSHPSAPAMPRPEGAVSLNQKMSIPKHLHDRATAPPQPVAMPSNRPTYSGGAASTSNGVMHQSVMAKHPPYSLNSEGEHVLSKKKLDELIRQVTGGGEGFENGEGLTAEVEESILSVADNFVDQVLQSACKNAKERGSKQLEIRDIQLTLERGYNIRIPGYASDEIRTVRKIQPSAAWISKMSAVQAAKVTGGKSGD